METQTVSQVAERIRAQMHIASISGRRLATELGMPHSYLARRLSGEVEFRESDLRQIAEFFGLPVKALFTAEGAA